MSDAFRPHFSPQRDIYDAFQEEASHRASRQPAEWMQAERERVFAVACEMADLHGLTRPTMEQVERAERSACGHVDYGAKWVYRVVEFMRGRR